MIRNAHVVAIDGTHATGKTTLTHACTARFRELGINACCVEDSARESPLVDDVVLHGVGDFDVLLELDLAARHITAVATAARTHVLIFTDKTLLNVAAYASILVGPRANAGDAELLEALNTLARSWQLSYDLVILCTDNYPVNARGDPYRSRVLEVQDTVQSALYQVYAESGSPFVEMPPGLSLCERSKFTEQLVRKRFPAVPSGLAT